MNLGELGAFLKSRRDRLRPSDVGLPTGLRRRVPGLRRDEVAQLSGISTEYFSELERGSGAQPSEMTLAALSRALRLSPDEHHHVFSLAGRPAPAPGGLAGHVDPDMLDLLHRLGATPAQIVTDLRVPLVQNDAAVALLGPPPPSTGWSASFVYRWFTEPACRKIYPPEDHDQHARAFVADLRAAMARRGGDDTETALMIDDLSARSGEFLDYWKRYDVGFRRNARKRLVHPDLGVLDLNCLNLFSEDGRQRLLWFTPAAGTESVAKLKSLAGTGS